VFFHGESSRDCSGEEGELITRCKPQSLGKIPDLLEESRPEKENRDNVWQYISEKNPRRKKNARKYSHVIVKIACP
jgi:hypothetical protein